MEESPFKGRTGLPRLINAINYSLQGFCEAFRLEDAFRQEVALTLVLTPLAFWLESSGPGRAMMIASLLLVLVVELVNSAIEATVDRISLENHHMEIGRAHV